LFYRAAGSKTDLRCNASTVNSPAKNLVFTAGRCVHSGYRGDWYDYVVFVPGYREGSAPYGRWFAKELWSNTAWTDSGDEGYNYGAVVFYPNAGQRLVDVVGANGIRWNYPVEQYTYTFGYPNNYAKGEVLQYCSGTTFGGGILDPRTMFLKCDFEVYPGRGRVGAFGGPWVMNFNGEVGLGYLHSITTGNQYICRLFASCQREIYGVRFDDAVKSFYNDVSVRY